MAFRHRLDRHSSHYFSFRPKGQGGRIFSHFVTRFAPSPTGYLHIGHVASALFARQMAGSAGRYFVRIEDIDATRCRAEYMASLFEDLTWLGLSSEAPPLHQSRNMPRYQAALRVLKSRHFLYPCTCTRQEVAQRACGQDPDGSPLYDGHCKMRGCNPDRPPLWRLDMARALGVIGHMPGWQELGEGYVAGAAASYGDVVLARRDNGASYHLCVTCDDADQNVTCVTRGADLRAATSVHRVLQKLLSFPEPVYAHHPLAFDEMGRKLSKSTHAPAIRDMRRNGVQATDIIKMGEAVLHSTG